MIAVAASGVRPAVPVPVIDPIDPKQFLEPIDFLLADHYRQRTLCQLLDRLTQEPSGAEARALAEPVRIYLRRDMVWHIADEEIQLFPRMRERAVPGDGTADMLYLLEREHTGDQSLAHTLLEALDCLALGLAPVEPAVFAVRVATFTETQRRHLAWENAMVIPLARRLLTQADKVDLGRKMALRRALAYPG